MSCNADVEENSKAAEVFNYLAKNVTHIHPNILTFFSLLSGLSCIYLLYKNYYFFSFILYLLHLVFDQLDGCTARNTGKTSTFGHWLDKTTDLIVLVGVMYVMYLKCKKKAIDILFIYVLYVVLTSFLAQTKESITPLVHNHYLYKIIFFLVLTNWCKIKHKLN